MNARGGDPHTSEAPDQIARDRIAHELDETLFVSAGAGSGKTTALVGRIINLVNSGVELRRIAAITFTEKAASELRDRIRREFETQAASQANQVQAEMLHAAIEQIDSAAIGTLHSFAQRILAENAIEAGLPPRIEVLDELSADIEFDRRWIDFRDQILDDPNLTRPISQLLSLGANLETLRKLAKSFDAQWDLVAVRVPDHTPDLSSAVDLAREPIAAYQEFAGLRFNCSDENDTLSRALAQHAECAERLAAIDDDQELLRALGEVIDGKPSFKLGTKGKVSNWGELKGDVIKQALVIKDALANVIATVAKSALAHLTVRFREFTLDSVEERRRSGRLTFQDLLVLAQRVVCDPNTGALVRQRLSERYVYLLLDEFQDTDPLQIELAVRIAARDPGEDAAATLPWPNVEIKRGRLFFVGDPKQSIYRFRRADIALFLTAQKRFGTSTGTLTELTANFRTAAPIISWVNEIFSRLFEGDPDRETSLLSQPGYGALVATRPSPPSGPTIAIMGAQPTEGLNAQKVRNAEAASVAQTILLAVDPEQPWSVANESTDDSSPKWRAARLSDITVLIPTRRSLPALEDALEDAGIPYSSEASSRVYRTEAVQDLLMALRAVDDPTDALAIFSALRSPLYGCGDDDLLRYRVQHHGSFNYLALTESISTERVDDPVINGLAHLRQLHEERHWHTPAEILSRIATDRRSFELAFSRRRPRTIWRQLRFVIDQARAWNDATGGTTREFLQWVGRQSDDDARVKEAVLPETDDDAVRIMTIHNAKGLEFPITILSGMSSQQNTARKDVVVFPGTSGVGYKLHRNLETSVWTNDKAADEQFEFDERIRLLYVACTRARDHLVVSMYRDLARPPKTPFAHNSTNAYLLWNALGENASELSEVGATTSAKPIVLPREPIEPGEPFEEWAKERDAVIVSASHRMSRSATSLNDDGEHDEREVEIRNAIADSDARYGTAVGSAVHAVLESIDLASGADLEDAARLQCAAEAIVDRVDDVTKLSSEALSTETVRAAASTEHWRELYVAAPVEGTLLEGYIDLMYRSPAGLVIVDYKTVLTADHDELARRADDYRLQLASYAMLIERTTGESVVRAVLLFLTPDGPVEWEVDRLRDAITNLEEQLRSD